jgi:hypothetical protein
MTELVELYKKLEQYSHFEEDEENYERFLDTVDAIVLKNDPSAIPELLKYLDDQCEYDYVQDHLTGALETFNAEDYVLGLLKNFQMCILKAQNWIDCLCNRIFNDPSYLIIFRQNMHLADKESLLKLFKIMEEESPHHRQLIQELRAEIETSPKE